MAKKICIALLSGLLILLVCGCSKGEEKQKYYWQAFYEEANYDKFKTPASENGLDGTLIKVTGTVKDVIKTEATTDEGKRELISVIVEDKDKKLWLGGIFTDGNVIPEKKEKITAYIEYNGIAKKYHNYPSGLLIRYTSGNITHKVKLTENLYGYLEIEGLPPNVKNWEIVTELGVDYYTIYLTSETEWNDLDLPKQTDLIKDCVEYFRDYSLLTSKDKYNVNIIALDSSGNNAFYCDKSDKVKIYKNGVYDYEWYIPE